MTLQTVPMSGSFRPSTFIRCPGSRPRPYTTRKKQPRSGLTFFLRHTLQTFTGDYMSLQVLTVVGSFLKRLFGMAAMPVLTRRVEFLPKNHTIEL